MKRNIDSKNPHVIIAILGLLTAFAPFATDTYLSGLPSIAESFHADIGRAQLTLSSFFLGLAIGQLFYGPLTDRFGRKIPLLGGVILFTLTSALCIFAPNMESLIALRFIQAVGGCAGMIVSLAIIQDMFKGVQAVKALSLMMVVQGVGPVVAPLAGSLILTYYSWHMIFGFLVLLGSICFLIALWGIPESLPEEKRVHHSPKEIASVFATLLKNSHFLIPTMATAFSMAMIFVYISASASVFMGIFELTKQQFSWLFALNAFGITMFSKVNSHLVNHFTPRQLFYGANIVGSLTGVGLILASFEGNLYLYIAALFSCLCLIPIMGANGTALAMSVSGRHAGSASSLLGVIRFAVAAGFSALVSVMHDGTALPMSGLIFACSFMAFLLLFFTKHVWWKGKRVKETKEEAEAPVGF